MVCRSGAAAAPQLLLHLQPIEPREPGLSDARGAPIADAIVFWSGPASVSSAAEHLFVAPRAAVHVFEYVRP